MARILIAAIALIALLGVASADSTPAIAQVTFRTGSISGVGFFAQVSLSLLQISFCSSTWPLTPVLRYW
jgi:uncharacterized protein YraI